MMRARSALDASFGFGAPGSFGARGAFSTAALPAVRHRLQECRPGGSAPGRRSTAALPAPLLDCSARWFSRGAKNCELAVFPRRKLWPAATTAAHRGVLRFVLLNLVQFMLLVLLLFLLLLWHLLFFWHLLQRTYLEDRHSHDLWPHGGTMRTIGAHISHNKKRVIVILDIVVLQGAA